MFIQTIETDFMFEEQQKMMLEVYDADDANQLQNLAKQDYIGAISFNLADVLTGKGQELTRKIECDKRKDSGSATIKATEKK